MFSCLRNRHTILLSGYINFHSHISVRESLFCTLSLDLLLDFWTIAILISVRCYLIAVLTCISLIISDICQLPHLQVFSLGSECCLFILFMVSLAAQKLLNLIRSHLFIFVFIFITLGGQSKGILLWFISKSVLPMFSSEIFLASGLTFRSLTYSEFIFMYGVWEYLISFFYM